MYSLESDKKCVKSDYFRSGSASEADGSDEVRFVVNSDIIEHKSTHTQRIFFLQILKRKSLVKTENDLLRTPVTSHSL